MTQIRDKEYGVNQEMFNMSNLLFTNQSICFLRQDENPASFKSSENLLNETFFKR